MKNGFVDRRIVNEIGNKLVAIREKHGIVSSFLNKLNHNALKKEAIIHSYKIEYPGTLGDTSNYNCHPCGREVKRGISNLNDAFIFGMRAFNPKNLNDSLVKGIAGKIDPELHKGEEAPYRECRVKIKGASWMPQLPSEVNGEMQIYFQKLMELLDDQTISSCLEAAAYSHLHFIRIHPFVDGNGRAARTIQNIVLAKNNLPPPIFYPGERLDYYARLQGAIEDWSARGCHNSAVMSNGALFSSREVSFYNYIAGKVSASLDRLV